MSLQINAAATRILRNIFVNIKNMIMFAVETWF